MARWLVDPQVAPRVRVARGIGYMLGDLGERNKLERMPRSPSWPPLPDPGPTYRTAAVRFAELEDAAAAAGLCPLRIGHTDVVARFGLGEGMYRILCAFAHGGQAVTFAVSDAGDPGELEVGLRNVSLEANVGRLVEVTGAAVHLTHRTLIEVFAYHGHAFETTPGT